MKRFRVADAARTDLDNIWNYIAHDDLEAADRFVRLLISKFPILASMPEMGLKRDELSPGLRIFPVHNYIIFYRPIKEGVEIVRVLHGARDLPPLFE